MSRPSKKPLVKASMPQAGDSVDIDYRIGLHRGGYLSLKCAEEYSDISVTQLQRLIKAGRLIISRPIPGRILVLRASLEALLATGINLNDSSAIPSNLFGEARERALQEVILQKLIAA